jgi:hypothetical protein
MMGDTVLMRTDPRIDFDWGYGNVTVSASHDVAVRWTGYLKAPLSESFTLGADLRGYDVARVFVARSLVYFRDQSARVTPTPPGTWTLHWHP